MDQDYLDRADLSWAAKGMLAYLLIHPRGTLVSMRDLYAMSKDDLTSTNHAIGELVNKGICQSICLTKDQSKCPPGHYLLVGG